MHLITYGIKQDEVEPHKGNETKRELLNNMLGRNIAETPVTYTSNC